MGGGAAIAPPPIPGSSQMKMQFVPASHGQNTLGTDVPRIIRHDGAKNRVGRVPGTRTGAADLDYEGNVYTEKRVMWETLSPEHPVPKTLKWRIIIVDTFSARAAPEWKSVSYHVEHGYLLVEVCVINKCYCLF